MQRVLENQALYNRLLADGLVTLVERGGGSGRTVPAPVAKPEPS